MRLSCLILSCIIVSGALGHSHLPVEARHGLVETITDELVQHNGKVFCSQYLDIVPYAATKTTVKTTTKTKTQTCSVPVSTTTKYKTVTVKAPPTTVRRGTSTKYIQAALATITTTSTKVSTVKETITTTSYTHTSTIVPPVPTSTAGAGDIDVRGTSPEMEPLTPRHNVPLPPWLKKYPSGPIASACRLFVHPKTKTVTSTRTTTQPTTTTKYLPAKTIYKIKTSAIDRVSTVTLPQTTTRLSVTRTLTKATTTTATSTQLSTATAYACGVVGYSTGVGIDKRTIGNPTTSLPDLSVQDCCKACWERSLGCIAWAWKHDVCDIHLSSGQLESTAPGCPRGMDRTQFRAVSSSDNIENIYSVGVGPCWRS